MKGVSGGRPDTGDRGLPASRHVRRRGPFSSLTRRILAINVLALLFLVGGLFYLDEYREGLVEAKLAAMTTQAELIAGALGESAVTGRSEAPKLDVARARQIMRRLVETAGVRARLFKDDGTLVADSRFIVGAGRRVVTRRLPSPEGGAGFFGAIADFYDWVVAWVPQNRRFPPYLERADQSAEDYSEAAGALRGEVGWGRREAGADGIILSVAVPVQAFKKVQGALFITTDDADVEQAVRDARIAVLQVFAVALGITVLLSLYLAGTIARPVRRLAEAADRVRRITGRRVEIPDFTSREDEIGDLSGALRDMTRSLYARLDAIETFAADVSHEIKNPLTSLRSAVETFARVDDPERRQKLLRVIESDVIRLDRLISDISDASRLDAELSRTEFKPVDVAALMRALAETYRNAVRESAPGLVLDIEDRDDLVVMGAENRIARVLRNLIDNAVTFSPPGGRIGLAVWRDDGAVLLMVEDEGPGIPDDKLEAVFERFYSARPEGEAFGSHSGLGLSISKQIVEAHGGTVTARNRRNPMGNVVGARFILRLPAADAKGSKGGKGGKGGRN